MATTFVEQASVLSRRNSFGDFDVKRLLPAGDYNAELTFGQNKVKQSFHVDLAEGITPR